MIIRDQSEEISPFTWNNNTFKFLENVRPLDVSVCIDIIEIMLWQTILVNKQLKIAVMSYVLPQIGPI